MRTRIRGWQRVVSSLTAFALLSVQLVLPPRAEASLGSSTASAGNVPPPSVSAVQSFQPDLFTGRATTSIPIAVPPGRKGIQPSLALSYSSSSRNGWLGVGWGLDLGYIERSTKNGVPKYDSSDTYAFMFQGVASDLVQIPDLTYRAKDEGLFLRFENKGSPNGWEVRDKSGTRYLFGGSPDSEQTVSGKTARWCLRKVVDTNGNFLTVSYTADQGQLYPARIDYTGHEVSDVQDVSPVNAVTFTTEMRPDTDVSYRSGFQVRTTQRLKEIAAYVQGQLARKYMLAYAQSQRTGRSLLSTVTQIGADGMTSLPPTTFAYQDTSTTSYTLSSNNPSTSQVAWNVRKANHDFLQKGPDFTCGAAQTQPYAALSWSSPTVVSGSADLGGVSASVDATGAITISGYQNYYAHAWTWLYLATPGTVSLNAPGFCAWQEAGGAGVSPIPNVGSFSLPAGWSILHLTAHNEYTSFTAQETTPLVSQVSTISPSQFTKPQFAGDMDGNGATDLVKFDAVTGTWSVSLSHSTNFSPETTWLPSFGNNSSIPLMGDWNADGRTDVAIYTTGSWQFATSTATSFQANAIGTFTFGSGTPLTGDFNGDGITDIGTYNNGAWSIALGNGAGFASAGSLSLNFGSSNDEPLTGDFNGDGLTDVAIVSKSSGDVRVALSTGTSFATDTVWLAGFGAGQSHTSADFNGDGLTDVAYYDRSSGQVRYALATGTQFNAPISLPVTFSLRSADDGLQVGDFNGDGLADPAVFNTVTGASQLANSQGQFVDLLATTANGIGGSTVIQYQPSTQCDNVCPVEHVPKLPFILPVVNKVTVSDGMGHAVATTYSFKQGRYDAPTREFRGFGKVDVRDANGNTATTQFFQDDEKKGRPFHSEFRDAFGNLWTVQDQTWTSTAPYLGVHFVTLDQTDAFIYDGDATFRQTRSRFTYDQYGNITRADADGEVGVIGDERSAVTTYATANPAAWILNKPSLTQTLDVNGNVVAQRRFYYDGSASTTNAPTLGNLTKEEEWLNFPAQDWLATALAYDAYGNVKTVTDALGRTTTNTYDVSGTYLTQIANALGHTRTLAYDTRLGQVVSSTDQNSQITTTEYDALGRVTKLIGPNNSSALPTISYEYDLSSVPSKTVVRTRLTSGGADELTSYAFSDGLGRTIQTRSPSEAANKQIATGAFELNARGLVVKQWVPYLSDASSTYVPFSLEPSASTLASVSYTYDPMGRLLTTTNPDGSVTSTAYDDWSVTAIDANGHQTRQTSDAYGRLAMVEEFDNGQTHTTTYQYDALGNLARVTDALGNVTAIAYDSLGRKLSMDDPDMAHWDYRYDAVDNLTSQTDARGVATTFTYDALNRLTQKSYVVPPALSLQPTAPVSYTYDDPGKPFSKGKLTGITDGSGSSGFEYDNLGRLIKEFKTIDATTYTIQRQYDLLGRLTALTYPDNEVATYTYNPQGGIETIGLDSLTTGHQSLITGIDYNAAGQITKMNYGNGVVTDYSYNPQTLRLDHLVSDSPAGRLQDFSYAFDSVGNVTGITDAVHTGTQTFQYDPLNRLTRAAGAYGTMTYAYNAIGNMTEKEGATMSYGLPDGSKPHAVTSLSNLQLPTSNLQISYDANGNLIEKRPQPPAPSPELTAQQFAYDAENRLVKVDTAQDDTESVTFKPGWNFFSLPVIPDNSSVAAIFPNFSRDFEQIAKFVPTSNLQPPTSEHFEHYVGNTKFDDFNTLDYGVGYQIYCKSTSDVTVSLKGKLPTKKLSKSLAPGWQLLPAISTQQTALSTIFGSLSPLAVKRYDPATSSLQTATQIDPEQAYWVQLGASATWSPPLPKNVTTSFVYDGDGGKVKQITASGTTTYLGEVYEKSSDGKETKYLFAGSQRIVAVTREPVNPQTRQLSFYHTDHLGSSNVITDASGQLVELTEHTPYGAVARTERANAQTGQPANPPIGFTGQRQDSGTGLILFPARAYDPQLGRFIQADPFVQDPSDPQTLNRYAYVRNNPVNLVDPSGYKWSWKAFFGIVAIVAIVVVTAGVAAPAIAGAAGAAGAAIGGGIGAGIEAGIGAAAGFAAAAAPYAAFAGVASGTGYFLTPGASSPGFAAAVGAATAASGAVLGAGPGLAASAVLGNAALQGGVTYAGMRLLDTPLAQEGIGRAAGALESLGMAPWAALLLAGVTAGTVVFGALSAGVSAAGLQGLAATEGTEVVQRAMSRAELGATRRTGLLRGGHVGTAENPHYVSEAVNSNALRARQRLSLRQTPEVRATLEIPKGVFSPPSEVGPMYGMPGGGTERAATGRIPVRILRADEY